MSRRTVKEQISDLLDEIYSDLQDVEHDYVIDMKDNLKRIKTIRNLLDL